MHGLISPRHTDVYPCGLSCVLCIYLVQRHVLFHTLPCTVLHMMCHTELDDDTGSNMLRTTAYIFRHNSSIHVLCILCMWVDASMAVERCRWPIFVFALGVLPPYTVAACTAPYTVAAYTAS